MPLERGGERGCGARRGHRARLGRRRDGGGAPAAHVLAHHLGGVGGGPDRGTLGGKFHRRGDSAEVPAQALLPHPARDRGGRVGDGREGEGVHQKALLRRGRVRGEERLEERADERGSGDRVAVDHRGGEGGGGRRRSLRGGARLDVLALAAGSRRGLDGVAVLVALDGLGEEQVAEPVQKRPNLQNVSGEPGLLRDRRGESLGRGWRGHRPGGDRGAVLGG